MQESVYPQLISITEERLLYSQTVWNTGTFCFWLAATSGRANPASSLTAAWCHPHCLRDECWSRCSLAGALRSSAFSETPIPFLLPHDIKYCLLIKAQVQGHFLDQILPSVVPSSFILPTSMWCHRHSIYSSSDHFLHKRTRSDIFLPGFKPM